MSEKKAKHDTAAIYKKLAKQYTDEEIAESFVFPSQLTVEQQHVAHEEFKKLRQAQLSAMTDEEIMYGSLVRMKYLVQDYLRGGEYSIKYSFANQLKEYMTLTRRSQKKLGGELNIEKTKLNKLLSGKVNPSMDICYRLEKHSDNILPALLWYDLHLKQLAYEASSNDAIRVAAYQQVTGGLFLKQTS